MPAAGPQLNVAFVLGVPWEPPGLSLCLAPQRGTDRGLRHLPAPCGQVLPLSSRCASGIFQEASRDLPAPKDWGQVTFRCGEHLASTELRERGRSPLRWLKPGRLVLRAQEGTGSPA